MTSPIPAHALGNSIQTAVDAADLLGVYDALPFDERLDGRGPAMIQEVQARALVSIAQSLAYMTTPAFGFEVLRP